MAISASADKFSNTSTITITPAGAPAQGGTVIDIALGSKTPTILSSTAGWTLEKRDHPNSAGAQIFAYKNGANAAPLQITMSANVTGSWAYQVNDAQPFKVGSLKWNSGSWGTWNGDTKALSQTPMAIGSRVGAFYTNTRYPRNASAETMTRNATSANTAEFQPVCVSFTKLLSTLDATGDLVIWPYDPYTSEAIPTAPRADGDEQWIVSSFLWELAGTTLVGAGTDIGYIPRANSLDLTDDVLTWACDDDPTAWVVKRGSANNVDGVFDSIALLDGAEREYTLVNPPSGTSYYTVVAVTDDVFSAFALPGLVSSAVTAPPGLPVIDMVATDDVVSVSEMPVTITGTTEPDEDVSVTIGSVTKTTTADGSGDYSVTFASNELPVGGAAIVGVAINPAGFGVLTQVRPIVVQPRAPTLTVPSAGESPRTVTGTAGIGTTVSMTIDAVTAATGLVVDGSGNWSVPVTAPPGTYSLEAFAVKEGQISPSSGAESLVVNAAPPPPPPPPAGPPAPPQVDAINPAVSPRRITGRGVPGAALTAFESDVEFAATTIDQVGDWAVSFVGSPGTYSFTATQEDALGESDPSDPVSFVILADVVPDIPQSSPKKRHRHGQKDEEDPPAPTPAPATERALRVPFRRPRRW